MENPKKGSRNRVAIFAAIGIGAFAIFAIILFSGFSIGTLTETTPTPFGEGGPPEIVLINNGTTYEGAQYGYTFSETTESFLELPDINTAEITAVPTDNIVSVEPGSQIQFAVEGSPPRQLQPDSFSVTAYTEDGIPVAVLDNISPGLTVSEVQSYSLDNLQPGVRYILLSTATWVDPQDSRALAGYVYYIHRISLDTQ
ncbi:MAG: hypothetical protein M3115_06485 [Thermoproteota archaeon]|nr:hypothetical protein [Thermoproteota archaeon]